MSKHTPGPWTVVELENGWRQNVTDENGDLVCTVIAGPIDVPEFGPHPVDIARKTATIIAAAPRMVDALRESADFLAALLNAQPEEATDLLVNDGEEVEERLRAILREIDEGGTT